MRESILKNKKYWELLWHALSLNEEYERFLRSDAPKIVDRYNQRLRNHRPGMKPISQPASLTKWGIWVDIYSRFGDVHRQEFEQWWARRESSILASPPHYFQSCADYGDFWAGWDIDQAFANSGPVEDTEDFRKRFKKFFLSRIWKDRIVHIMMDPEEDVRILDAQYRKILKRRRTRLARGGSPRLAEVAEFLNLYKLHKKDGLDVIEIVKKVGSETQKEAAVKKTRAWYDIKREYKFRIDRGKEIVENLRKGLFPHKDSDPDEEIWPRKQNSFL